MLLDAGYQRNPLIRVRLRPDIVQPVKEPMHGRRDPFRMHDILLGTFEKVLQVEPPTGFGRAPRISSLAAPVLTHLARGDQTLSIEMLRYPKRGLAVAWPLHRGGHEPSARRGAARRGPG
jgi:hypothetical protein